MKCIQYAQTGEIKRVDDEYAAHVMKVAPTQYRYVPKSAWKAQKAAEAAKKAEG